MERTYIGEHAFYNCSALGSIKLPKNISSIKKSTFAGCSSLTQITVPGLGVSCKVSASNINILEFTGTDDPAYATITAKAGQNSSSRG